MAACSSDKVKFSPDGRFLAAAGANQMHLGDSMRQLLQRVPVARRFYSSCRLYVWDVAGLSLWELPRRLSLQCLTAFSSTDLPKLKVSTGEVVYNRRLRDNSPQLLACPPVPAMASSTVFNCSTFNATLQTSFDVRHVCLYVAPVACCCVLSGTVAS